MRRRACLGLLATLAATGAVRHYDTLEDVHPGGNVEMLRLGTNVSSIHRVVYAAFARMDVLHFDAYATRSVQDSQIREMVDWAEAAAAHTRGR